jgi:hypothetical protein
VVALITAVIVLTLARVTSEYGAGYGTDDTLEP